MNESVNLYVFLILFLGLILFRIQINRILDDNYLRRHSPKYSMPPWEED